MEVNTKKGNHKTLSCLIKMEMYFMLVKWILSITALKIMPVPGDRGIYNLFLFINLFIWYLKQITVVIVSSFRVIRSGLFSSVTTFFSEWILTKKAQEYTAFNSISIQGKQIRVKEVLKPREINHTNTFFLVKREKKYARTLHTISKKVN